VQNKTLEVLTLTPIDTKKEEMDNYTYRRENDLKRSKSVDPDRDSGSPETKLGSSLDRIAVMVQVCHSLKRVTIEK